MPRTILRHGDLANRHNFTVAHCVVFAIGIVVWTGLTLGFDSIFARNAWQQYHALGYATAPGLITHSEVQEQDDGDGDGATYRAKLAYTYRVADREYHGARYGYDQSWSSDGGADRIVADHPVGKPVLVYYDPHDPADAVLHAGLDGSDLLLGLFVLPFNIVMLGLWGVATGTIYRRVARPVAGGAKTWDDGGRVHVRLLPIDPLCFGAAAAIGVDIIGMVIFGTRIGFAPTTPSILIVFGAILASGAGAYLYVEGRVARGLFDLVIDDLARTVSLPQTMGREAEVVVPIQYISAVEVQQHEEKDSDGQISYGFTPVLVFADGAGATRCEKLVKWRDHIAAQDLAAWLRQRLRIELPKQEVLTGESITGARKVAGTLRLPSARIGKHDSY